MSTCHGVRVVSPCADDIGKRDHPLHASARVGPLCNPRTLGTEYPQTHRQATERDTLGTGSVNGLHVRLPNPEALRLNVDFIPGCPCCRSSCWSVLCFGCDGTWCGRWQGSQGRHRTMVNKSQCSEAFGDELKRVSLISPTEAVSGRALSDFADKVATGVLQLVAWTSPAPRTSSPESRLLSSEGQR